MRLFLICVLSLSFPSVLTASDEPRWPSFRGERAGGNADGLNLPIEWDLQAKRGVDWQTEIPGLGHSSPIVWGDAIFLTTAVSDNPDSIFVHGLDGRIDRRSDTWEHSWRLYRLERTSGSVVWEKEVHRGVPKIQRHRKNSYASATPVTDGEYVVAYFGSEGLYCFDFDGTLVWKNDLGIVDAGASYDDSYDWGPASSPVIYRDTVVQLVDTQQESFIAAFSLADGSEVWRSERDVISSFSTPTVFSSETSGGADELVVNGAEWMHGYDPSTGRVLWFLKGSSKNTTPTPVVGDGLIFITSGYRTKPIFAVRPGGEGDLTPAEGTSSNRFVAWSASRDGSYMTTPIFYRGLLYTVQNNGVLSAYRGATGERIYQQRVAVGAFTASPIASDGRLYLASEDGDVFVIRAGDDYELIAQNTMDDVCMATPAAGDEGQLLIRSQRRLHSLRETEDSNQ